MADKHPYASGPGGVTQLISHLRKSFPPTVTADTLRKLSIAPRNETYVLNTMKFIGVLDAENKKTASAIPVFNKHDNADFQQDFAELVADPYHELFDLHGQDAWTLPLDKLISFFRSHDGTSEIVGKRQAGTFQTLARICGKLEDSPLAAHSVSKNSGSKTAKRVSPVKKPLLSPATEASLPASGSTLLEQSDQTKSGGAAEVGLTVRIEINLPPGGDQATYDAIFKSIRENLLNGKNT